MAAQTSPSTSTCLFQQPANPLPRERGRPQIRSNAFQDTLRILEYLTILEAEHRKPGFGHHGVSDAVVLSRRIVVGTVKLDDKARILTEEVREVGPQGLLASKLRADQTSPAQQRPQGLFCWRG
jgi:hypothetical protein